jgi:hypothetical protein
MVKIEISEVGRSGELKQRACANRAKPRSSGSHRALPVAGPAARFRRNLAVVIGIDTYGEGIPPLRSAVADARAIAELLERDHGFETWRVLDGEAGHARLLTLLEQDLPAALGPDDRLLFYFAGHGLTLDGEAGPTGYLVPAGARRSDRDGFLPMQGLHDALERLPVRHALVILDCCFAGTFQWPSMRDVEPIATIYRERYDRYLEHAAWQVLTSTRHDERALDTVTRDALGGDRRGDLEPHSPFALALLEGLSSGADYTHDNLITADELAMFVREHAALAGPELRPWQIPQLFPLRKHDGGQFVFQVPNRTPMLEPAPPLDEDANPYRGLESHCEHDRARFFGRDGVTAGLVDAVGLRQLTVVVGPSGSGKTSLVHAGLVPRLRADGWKILSAQPGCRPLLALAALARELRADPDTADPVAWAAAVSRRAGDGPWLVVIDQIEALLAPQTDPADRALFFEALAIALELSPSLHLLVIVRADAEPLLCGCALAPAWMPGRFVVPAMSRDELRQVIERPAAAAVVHFDSGRLVERLLDDVALVPAPLPLLSFALSELYRRCWKRWQAGARDRTLREADYDGMGGVAGALTQRATAIYDELVAEDPAYAGTIRNVFLRMVAVGKLARRRVPRYEFVYGSPTENRRVTKVLYRFERARLISRGLEQAETGGMTPYVEPVHDELVRWTLLRRWLDDLDAVPGRQALLGTLAVSVAAWRTNMLDAYLWNDPRVELIEPFGRTRGYAFNVHEALFVQRSARLRRRSQTRLVRGLVAIICLLAALAVLAVWQWSVAADEARARPRGGPYGTSL